jgi:predicted lipoprotein
MTHASSTKRRARRWMLAAACVLVTAFAIAGAGCKPWTVRPIDDSGASAGGTGAAAAAARFDPSAYVDTIWAAKVLPQAASDAVDLATALAAPSATPSAVPPAGNAASGPRSLLVRGAGVITKVDRQSRVGLAYVDLDPADGRPDAALQIGPVLRGTSLRDAVGFIRFADFSNQIDYARVGGALNDRVLATVLQTLPADLHAGQRVTFTGAVRLDARASAPAADATSTPARAAGAASASTPAIEIVPVTLRIEGAAQ